MNKPESLCDRCDNVMHCLLNYDGVPCRRSRTCEPINADVVRQAPIEQLAALCASPCPPDQQCGRNMCYPLPECVECWKKWLQSPAEENHD